MMQTLILDNAATCGDFWPSLQETSTSFHAVEYNASGILADVKMNNFITELLHPAQKKQGEDSIEVRLTEAASQA